MTIDASEKDGEMGGEVGGRGEETLQASGCF